MTLIEAFDRPHLQNVAGCLAIEPDCLVLVGNDPNMESAKDLYEGILPKTIQVITEPVNGTSFDAVKGCFTELIKKYSPCVIDVFGGDELHLMAAGAAYQQLRDDYDVTLLKMDMKQGRMVGLDDKGSTIVSKPPQLSIKDSVKLYGGAVFSEETDKLKDYSSADIDPIWDMVRRDPVEWNKMLQALNFFEGRNDCSKSALDAAVNLYCNCGACADVEDKRHYFRRMINLLEQAGIIDVIQNYNAFYRYRYKNDLVRACLKKEGNILEYKTYFTVRECVVNGERLFNDCAIGIMLDWDGVLHNPYGPSPEDTRNEIDIMAMWGVVPVFISCKNGTIDDEELYKLNTVAMRLGGEYSKKALIATDFEPNSLISKQAKLRRANDMGVAFAPDAATFSQADWNAFFESLMKS